MAADESFLEYYDNHLVMTSIVKIQALVRGKFTRRQLSETQQLYEKIVIDIEGLDTEVVWSENNVAIPVLRRIKPSKREQKHSTDTNKTLVKSGLNDHVQKKDFPVQPQAEQQTVREVPDKTQKTLDVRILNNDHLFLSSNGNSTPATTNRKSSLVCVDVQTDYENTVLPLVYQPCGEAAEVPVPANAEVQAEKTEPTSSILLNNIDDGEAKCSVYDRTESLLNVAHLLGGAEKTTVSSSDVSPRKKLQNDNLQSDSEVEKSSINNIIDIEIDPKKHNPYSGDTKMTDNFRKETHQGADIEIPDDKDQILQLKNTVMMELLWVQQAINSRKHYLRLRQQLQ